MPAWLLRRLMNIWSPFRGPGIVVTHLADDWRSARVELRQRLLNRNYVGTHFGGSLFSMTDPFYMLMLLRNLGSDYLVWDKDSSIEYLAPGRGTVAAEFALDEATLARIRDDAAGGAPVYPEFVVEIRDRKTEVVARVRKKLYVRLKPARRPMATAGNPG